MGSRLALDFAQQNPEVSVQLFVEVKVSKHSHPWPFSCCLM